MRGRAPAFVRRCASLHAFVVCASLHFTGIRALSSAPVFECRVPLNECAGERIRARTCARLARLCARPAGERVHLSVRSWDAGVHTHRTILDERPWPRARVEETCGLDPALVSGRASESAAFERMHGRCAWCGISERAWVRASGQARGRRGGRRRGGRGGRRGGRRGGGAGTCTGGLYRMCADVMCLPCKAEQKYPQIRRVCTGEERGTGSWLADLNIGSKVADEEASTRSYQRVSQRLHSFR